MKVCVLLIFMEVNKLSQLIRNWEELSKIPNESKTHILEVDTEMCCGWLRAKNSKPYKRNSTIKVGKNHYLSPNIFYQSNWSTNILRECGFDVEIVGRW